MCCCMRMAVQLVRNRYRNIDCLWVYNNSAWNSALQNTFWELLFVSLLCRYLISHLPVRAVQWRSPCIATGGGVGGPCRRGMLDLAIFSTHPKVQISDSCSCHLHDHCSSEFKGKESPDPQCKRFEVQHRPYPVNVLRAVNCPQLSRSSPARESYIVPLAGSLLHASVVGVFYQLLRRET